MYEIIEKNNDLKEFAVISTFNNLLDKRFVLDAVDNCNYLIEKYPNSSLKDFTLYKLFRINLEYLGNSAKSEELLSKSIEVDKRNNYVSYAKSMLTDFKEGRLKRILSDIELANIANNRIGKNLSKESYSVVKEVPSEFGISQNYPNPFNPVTTIKFALPEVSNVKIRIYNMLGQEIETLINDNLNAGYHEIKWDGSRCASGIYICRFEAGGYNKAIKLLLIK